MAKMIIQKYSVTKVYSRCYRFSGYFNSLSQDDELQEFSFMWNPSIIGYRWYLGRGYANYKNDIIISGTSSKEINSFEDIIKLIRLKGIDVIQSSI